MTKDQIDTLLRYIDKAVDAKLEAIEEGADGYRGVSKHEERLRRAAEADLRAALRETSGHSSGAQNSS